MTRCQSMDELLAGLQAHQVKAVTLMSKVATTTSPGGQELTFRGRVVVCADLGGGARAEYVEQVESHITKTGAPEVPLERERADELQRCRDALTCQLRAYRSEYQGAMEAARRDLTERLTRAGVSVVEPEE